MALHDNHTRSGSRGGLAYLLERRRNGVAGIRDVV